MPTLAAQKACVEDGAPGLDGVHGLLPGHTSSNYAVIDLAQQAPVAEFAEELFDGPVEVVGAFDDEVGVGL